MHSINNHGYPWDQPRYAVGPPRPQYGWGPRWGGVPEVVARPYPVIVPGYAPAPSVVYNVDPVPVPQPAVQYVQQPVYHRPAYSDDCCNPSFGTLILLACLVMWCCGFLFGLIAFILAVSGRDRAHVGDGAEAHRLARASLWVSIAGIVIAVVVVVVTTSVTMTNTGPYGPYMD